MIAKDITKCLDELKKIIKALETKLFLMRLKEEFYR